MGDYRDYDKPQGDSTTQWTKRYTLRILCGLLAVGDFNGLLQQRIFRLTFGLVGTLGRQWLAVFVEFHLGLRLRHYGFRRNAHVLDGLAARRVILGYRENDGATVIHSDGLAEGGIAVSPFA